MKLLRTLLAAGVAFALLPGCSSDSSSSGDSSNESSVTLTGSMSQQDRASQQQNSQSTARIALATTIVYSDYKLYCVTFTDPPNAGTGIFDATGNFSVTIDNAAGLAVGCFIQKVADNSTVATVTFDTGTASGLSDGGDASVALSGGAFTVNIAFDPETGSATADVSALSSSFVDTSTTAFEVNNLGGTWDLSCPPEDLECNFGDPQQPQTSVRVFFDILTGTDAAAKTVHGMGVWESEAAFTQCGGTEMVKPDGITGLTSTGNPTGDMSLPFAGMLTDATFFGGDVPMADTTTVPVTTLQKAAITSNNLRVYLDGLADASFHYPANPWYPEWADSTNGWEQCPGAITPATYPDSSTETFDLLNIRSRNCLVNWFQMASERGVPNLATPLDTTDTVKLSCAPRSHDVWKSAAMRWPGDGVPDTNTGDTPLLLRNPMDPPEISSRMTLMPLKVEAGTGVAFDRWYNEWEEWYEDTTTVPSTWKSRLCKEGNEMQIVFIPKDLDNGVGKFSGNDFKQCGTDPIEKHYFTFDVKMTRVTTP